MARKGLAACDAKVEMTPMIDVVFQLLIFFVVTLKQEDILSKLMASRPAPDPNAKPENQPQLINIEIYETGFVFRGEPVDLQHLDSRIERYSKISKDASVLIKCKGTSPQKLLVQCLDVCSKYGMTNLSIFSM